MQKRAEKKNSTETEHGDAVSSCCLSCYVCQSSWKDGAFVKAATKIQGVFLQNRNLVKLVAVREIHYKHKETSSRMMLSLYMTTPPVFVAFVPWHMSNPEILKYKI